MLIAVLVTLFAGVVAIPVFVFALEIILALVAHKRGFKEGEILLSRPKIAVLVPAHNEEATISLTLEGICAQLRKTDKLIVVADNCEDKTADIAKKSGAIVLERFDIVNKGKGFALDFGVQFLAESSPDVVIFIDADCIIGPDLIDHVSTLSVSKNRPIQALYLMKNRVTSPALSKRLAEFAWRIKNHARPLGLKLIGLPCHLMGSGIAIPMQQLCTVNLASANIVEDVQLGIDLTAAGYPPVYCPEVEVTSYFPDSEGAARSQRKRWEHGHIGMTYPST